MLSLVIPGAGTMYAGRVTGGLVWLFASVFGYVIFWPMGVLLHLLSVILAPGDVREMTRPKIPTVAPGGQVARVDGACATCGTPLAADAYFCPVCRQAAGA